ncbi:MAG TPA: hypothetical protein VGF97_17780 [Rhizomicrobium sp.]|jgi:hypothetical protein
MSDVTIARPEPRRPNFWVLMFGSCAAPVFWLGQLMMAYWVSAETCYGGDHPTTAASPEILWTLLLAFDAVAVIAALAGTGVSLACWRAADAGETRSRFMSIWGIFSSLCFLAAIIFESIASISVPICAH